MASKRGREEKQKVRWKRVGKEGNRKRRREKKHISAFALPTCHSTLLAGCQHAPLQTQLQVTKSSHCPTQGVPSMFYAVNCIEMPNAYKQGNYILERATNCKLLSRSNKLVLRPRGSLKNNTQDHPANSKKQLYQEV